METVNVSGLKNNPSEALRLARQDVVVVMNRDRPGVLSLKGVRPAPATALFHGGQLPLVRAARLAEIPVAQFVAHLSRLGIPVVNLDAQEAAKDLDTLDEWLASP